MNKPIRWREWTSDNGPWYDVHGLPGHVAMIVSIARTHYVYRAWNELGPVDEYLVPNAYGHPDVDTAKRAAERWYRRYVKKMNKP